MMVWHREPFPCARTRGIFPRNQNTENAGFNYDLVGPPRRKRFLQCREAIRGERLCMGYTSSFDLNLREKIQKEKKSNKIQSVVECTRTKTNGSGFVRMIRQKSATVCQQGDNKGGDICLQKGYPNIIKIKYKNKIE